MSVANLGTDMSHLQPAETWTWTLASGRGIMITGMMIKETKSIFQKIFHACYSLFQVLIFFRVTQVISSFEKAIAIDCPVLLG